MRCGRVGLGAGVVAVVAGTVLGLAGCGGDDPSPPDDISEPGGSSAPSEETAGSADGVGPPCDVITDDDLTTWTGFSREVAGPEDRRGEVECRTIGDPDDGHLVSWTFEPSTGDHEQDVAGASTSATERQDIEVPAAGPGVVLTDESLRLVTVLTWSRDDARLLNVRVLDSGTGDEDLTTDHLAQVATRIVGAYGSFERSGTP